MDEILKEEIRTGIINIKSYDLIGEDLVDCRKYIETMLDIIKTELNKKPNNEDELFLINHYVLYSDYLDVIKFF